MAAVLACGPNAVLSHRSAAALWGIRRGDAIRTDVIERAEALRLSYSTPLAPLVRRYPGRRGTAVLNAIVGAEKRPAGMSRSELEDRFLSFLAERGLPAPRTNVWLQLGEDWIEVDCAWPDQRLVAEPDSWAHHGSQAAFRRDRARDRRLKVAAWQPIRVTAWDIEEQPQALEAELLALTGARRALP
jgi:very-short-patch-repair endonuclease